MAADPMLPPGSRYCHCRTCGAYFGGERAFDVHRVGPMDDRRCLPRSGMQQAGLYEDSSGYWRRRVMSRKRDRAGREATRRREGHRDTLRAQRNRDHTTIVALTSTLYSRVVEEQRDDDR